MTQPFRSLGEKRALGLFNSTLQHVPAPTYDRSPPVTVHMPMAAPPPPAAIDPQERADASRILGVTPGEITDVTDHADGVVIWTTDGASYLILNSDHEQRTGPDDDGVRIFERADWAPATRGGFAMARPVYLDPAAQHQTTTSEWTMAHLLAEGERRAGAHPHLYAAILAENDPRSAMGLLISVARKIGMNRRVAITQNATAKAAWKVICESGWLAPEELAAL